MIYLASNSCRQPEAHRPKATRRYHSPWKSPEDVSILGSNGYIIILPTSESAEPTTFGVVCGFLSRYNHLEDECHYPTPVVMIVFCLMSAVRSLRVSITSCG